MKKLVMVLVGLAVFGIASMFALEGKKIDPEIIMDEYPVSYDFIIQNKSQNEVSFYMIKFSSETCTEVIEYIAPANTTSTINFKGTEGSIHQIRWSFGYQTVNDGVWWGSADWWSEQDIVIDKNGWLTHKENGGTKKVCQMRKR